MCVKFEVDTLVVLLILRQMLKCW